MRIFKINPKIEIVCDYASGVRDGFTHIAKLMINGREVDSARAHYINRTWESYEFQSVMQRLIEKTSALSNEEKEMVKKWLQGDRTDWSGFKATGMAMMMGDLIGGDTEKEKNTWKTRMLKAGMGNKGLELPDDWENLDEKTKKARLDMTTNFLMEAGKTKKDKLKSKLKKEVKVWS